MSVDDKVQTTVRIDPGLLKQIKQACLDRGTNQTAAIGEGLHLWLDRNGHPDIVDGQPVSRLPRSKQRLVDLFTQALEQDADPEILRFIEVLLKRMPIRE